MYSYPLHSAISVFRIQAANHLPECMFKFEGCRYRKLSTWMWICQGSLNSRHDWWVATCNHADDYYSSHTVSHIGCTGWEYNFSAILPFGLGDSLCILGTAYTTWCFGMFSKTPTPWYGNASPSISALTFGLKLADIVDPHSSMYNCTQVLCFNLQEPYTPLIGRVLRFAQFPTLCQRIPIKVTWLI